MDKLETESRGTLDRKVGVCSLKGCNQKKITLLLETYRDRGQRDRTAQFCCETHLITWVLLYAALEMSDWTIPAKSIDQNKVDSTEAIVEEIMDDVAKGIK